MDEGAPEELRRIWRQDGVPVIYTRGKGFPLLVRVPFDLTIKHWLRGGRHRIPVWVSQYKCWGTPKAWFDSLLSQLLRRYGKLYVIQPHRDQERCARACWEAQGDECECQCMGEYHGKDRPGGRWYEVSDTFAISWGEPKLAYRLLVLP
jgi:hypothetical protein